METAPLRVRFDATVDDFLDATLRGWRLEQRRLPVWRRDPVLGAVFTAALLFVVARPPTSEGLFWGAVGAVAGWFAYPRVQTQSLRRRSRRAFREWFAGAPTLQVQVEPRREGLWLAQGASEMLFPWRDLVAVHENEAGEIEVAPRYGGLILVRAAAFSDAAHRTAFMRGVVDNWRAVGEAAHGP